MTAVFIFIDFNKIQGW